MPTPMPMPADAQKTKKRVTILLCTFNGANFLQEQLTSISRQTHQDWRLVVSDDGSQDQTLEILKREIADPAKIEIRSGPRQGVCKNYMSLATDASIAGDYFAFCDQDDIWAPEKLARAIAQLETNLHARPALYFSRMQLISVDGRPLGLSRHCKRPPSFENALVENIASGNTIVMNRSARDLLVAAGPLDVAMHDWWAYMLITGAGGSVCYDERPSMHYRQHRVNAVGVDRGFEAIIKRVKRLLSHGFAEKNAMNVAALQKCRHLLRAESRFILDVFAALRSSTSILRVLTLNRAKIRRQRTIDQVSLFFAAALKLI